MKDKFKALWGLLKALAAIAAILAIVWYVFLAGTPIWVFVVVGLGLLGFFLATPLRPRH